MYMIPILAVSISFKSSVWPIWVQSNIPLLLPQVSTFAGTTSARQDKIIFPNLSTFLSKSTICKHWAFCRLQRTALTPVKFQTGRNWVHCTAAATEQCSWYRERQVLECYRRNCVHWYNRVVLTILLQFEVMPPATQYDGTVDNQYQTVSSM